MHESGVADQSLEILEPDPPRRANAVPIGHGVIDRTQGWSGYDRKVDEQDRQHEEPRHDFAPQKGATSFARTDLNTRLCSVKGYRLLHLQRPNVSRPRRAGRSRKARPARTTIA